MKMKVAAVTGVKQTDLVEKEVTDLPEGWALVKIYAAPMCTEYRGFLDGTVSECLGHEAAGEVVAVAPGSAVSVGDRVVVMPTYPEGRCKLCRAGDYIHCEHQLAYNAPTYAQYIAKPSFLLPQIPEGISYELASLSCCGLGASFGAMNKLGVDAFTTLLITGLGPVGLGAIVNAAYRGARIIAVEMNAHRIELARALGVTDFVDPRDPSAAAQIRALTGGIGPDCAIDCSGSVAAHRLLIDAVRRLGKIAFVGESGADTPLRVSPDMLRKGLTLIGSWHYNLNDFPKLMDVIRHSPLAGKLITHTYPLSRIQEALEMSASQQSGKIILKPWG